MGKRVQAQAFLDGVIDHGAHFCTYLLGTDMEMNTPEGFALMNWETGYGDWIAEPIWDTLRVLPWLEKTALVLGDTYDHEGKVEIPVSPRTILKTQVAKAASMGLTVKAGSEFEYYVLKETWEESGRNGWHIPERFGYYNEDYHLLQATKAEPLHRLLRNQMTEARIPVEFSKGEAAHRPARGEHPLRRCPRIRRPERDLQARGEGDRLPQRLGHHVHGQAGPHLDGTLRAPPHERLERGRLAVADPRRRHRAGPYGMSDTMA